MLSMWIVSQQPNEYNPIHIHTECQLSCVMYLKIPKFEPCKKDHRDMDDGCYCLLYQILQMTRSYLNLQ